jgi:hypothetical protein
VERRNKSVQEGDQHILVMFLSPNAVRGNFGKLKLSTYKSRRAFAAKMYNEKRWNLGDTELKLLDVKQQLMLKVKSDACLRNIFDFSSAIYAKTVACFAEQKDKMEIP